MASGASHNSLLLPPDLAPPFNGNDDYEILDAVKRGNFSFGDDEWENVSSKAKTLIQKMLNKGKKSRIVDNLTTCEDPK